MNQRADKKVPATTPPMVTAVLSRRNTWTDSMAISTARATVDRADIPAHSQVASGDGEAEGFGEVPSGGHQQPQGAGELT